MLHGTKKAHMVMVCAAIAACAHGVAVEARAQDATPAPAPPPSAAAADGSDAPAPVKVHIQSNNPDVQLVRITEQWQGTYVQGQGWTTICRPPCGRAVDPGLEYQILGGGATASSHFVLPTDKPALTLKVDAGSAGGWVGGLILTSLGFTAALTGGIVALVANDNYCLDTEPNCNAGLRMSMGILAAAGVVAMIPGIILWLNNRTHVTTDGGLQLASTTRARGPHFGLDGLKF